MYDPKKVDKTLQEAQKLESEYDWLGAAEICERALGEIGGRDSSRAEEIGEKIGCYLHRAAFQAPQSAIPSESREKW